MPVLVGVYGASSVERRADIANVFYFLDWMEAVEAMLEDMHTDHQRPRLAVQRAIGRVRNDHLVVDTLLDTLVNDPEPLFREKAGCGQYWGCRAGLPAVLLTISVAQWWQWLDEHRAAIA